MPYNFSKGKDGFYWSSQLINYNRDAQLKGMSINASIEWFFIKNTTLGLTQSLRYNPVYYQSLFSEEHATSSLAKYSIIFDTEINVKHYFTLRNQDKIFLNAAYIFMNQNTSYSTTHNDSDNGNFITQGSFEFGAYKLGIGYQYKNLEINLGTYLASNNAAFSDSGNSNFGIPYLKLNYIISKF